MTMRKTPRELAGAALLLTVLLSGCGVTEENPLDVNAAREASTGPVKGSPAGTVKGEDPLNIGVDGAKLCGVQPKDSFQEYTVMLHNPTLEEFTFGDIALGAPQGLRMVSAEITPANKEGHSHHGAEADAGHSGHGASAAPSTEPAEPSTFLVDPVPAKGYRFTPDSHINIVVAVALEEGVDNGTAEDIRVRFASSERDYDVAHNLEIEIDRTSCS
ncbi:hypothetical protein [uncultured Arthrobacter sp.]|uniref:hypothetical protein n=1 Tax=uncultured Arthrobacter sp. TaxID=114050 RepID=UPI0025FF86AC|nr:hypothetical protein [uncultured Arthrobacter sp.]